MRRGAELKQLETLYRMRFRAFLLSVPPGHACPGTRRAGAQSLPGRAGEGRAALPAHPPQPQRDGEWRLASLAPPRKHRTGPGSKHPPFGSSPLVAIARSSWPTEAAAGSASPSRTSTIPTSWAPSGALPTSRRRSGRSSTKAEFAFGVVYDSKGGFRGLERPLTVLRLEGFAADGVA